VSIEKQYRKLNDQLIRARTLRDEAVRKLSEEFGHDTVEEAEKAADKLERWIDKKEAQLERQLDQFEKENQSVLEDD
jgi:gas vesicle protein